MKVYAISDLHMSLNNPKPMDIFGPAWDNYLENIFADWKEKVTQEDVVIMAGDLSWAMTLENAQADINLIAQNNGKKIIIRGNHDYWWNTISKVRSTLPTDFYAIQNDALKIGEYIFCGSRGWVVGEFNKPLGAEDKKIYDREVIRMQMSLNEAKKLQTNNEKIIAIIHYPPYNSKKEDSEFTKLFEEYGVSKVVYGHLHGGRSRTDLYTQKNGIEYFLTSCDLTCNKLIEID